MTQPQQFQASAQPTNAPQLEFVGPGKPDAASHTHHAAVRLWAAPGP
jgi:hypothetical protein